jgi:hypothetical protein
MPVTAVRVALAAEKKARSVAGNVRSSSSGSTCKSISNAPFELLLHLLLRPQSSVITVTSLRRTLGSRNRNKGTQGAKNRGRNRVMSRLRRVHMADIISAEMATMTTLSKVQ